MDLEEALVLAQAIETHHEDEGQWRGVDVAACIEGLVASVRALTDAGEALAGELGKWGWGDFHYGPCQQERSVAEPLAAWRKLMRVGEICD